MIKLAQLRRPAMQRTLAIVTALSLAGCASVDTSSWTPEQKVAYCRQLTREQMDIGLHMMMTMPLAGSGSRH
jgi:lipoprotein NlpI